MKIEWRKNFFKPLLIQKFLHDFLNIDCNIKDIYTILSLFTKEIIKYWFNCISIFQPVFSYKKFRYWMNIKKVEKHCYSFRTDVSRIFSSFRISQFFIIYCHFSFDLLGRYLRISHFFIDFIKLPRPVNFLYKISCNFFHNLCILYLDQ